MQYLVSFFAKEKRAGRFTLIVVLLSCGFKSSLYLPYDAISGSAM